MQNLQIQEAFIQLLTGWGLTNSQALVAGNLLLATTFVVVPWLSYLVVHRTMVRFLQPFFAKSHRDHFRLLAENNVLSKARLFIPGIVLYVLLTLSQGIFSLFTIQITIFLKSLITIYFIVITFLLLNALINYSEALYKTLKHAKRQPIKSYLQIVKLFLFVLATIISISILLNKSPLAFLTGLGALTALITFIFKDSIIGFISSIQLTVNDVVRIGDWIEIISYGVDGDVIEVSLSTVKVRNFDKTIVSVPSYALLTNGVKNWRGMEIAGGRRIKRSIYIDLHTIRFCTDADIAHFNQIPLLRNYLHNKLEAINNDNTTNNFIQKPGLTNIGTFRAYVLNYLTRHPQIRQDMACMVRQLAPTEHGLPIELYAFTNTIHWPEYETVQADIFDHLLAIASYFDLRVFQDVSNFVQFKRSAPASSMQAPNFPNEQNNKNVTTQA